MAGNFDLYWNTTMPVSKYHSIHLVEGKSFTTEESSIKVAVFPIQNYGQFIEFCKINGSARIHISVNLEERIMLHASYPASILLWKSLTQRPIAASAKMQCMDSPHFFFFFKITTDYKMERIDTLMAKQTLIKL